MKSFDLKLYKNLKSHELIKRVVRDMQKMDVGKDLVDDLEDMMLLIQGRSAGEAMRNIEIQASHYMRDYNNIEEGILEDGRED